MNNELTKAAISCIQEYEPSSGEYILGAYVLFREMSGNHMAQLNQLMLDGPVFDGDVIKKSECSDLIDWGLAVKVCIKGKQGFTAATYNGYNVWLYSGEFLR